MPFYPYQAYARFQSIQSTKQSELRQNKLMECTCNNNQILRGAAVNSYLNAFLRRANVGKSNEAAKYTCRICGAEWRRVVPSESSRVQLICTKEISGKVQE
jgi:hypothetical protein